MSERKEHRAHSKIDGYPDEVRCAVQEAVIRGDTYQDVVDMLAGMGYEISWSAVQSYGAKFSQRLKRVKDANEKAAAMVREMAGAKFEMSEATSFMMYQMLLDMNMAMEDGKPPKEFFQSVKAYASLAHSEVSRERLKYERDKGERAAAERITKALNEELRKYPDVLERINEVLAEAAKT
jgi:hypothetical protein